MSRKTKGLFKKIVSSVLSAACVLSTAAVTGSILAPAASAADTSMEDAPFTWDNATVYFLLIDRFKNGNTSNDYQYGRMQDANGNKVSGAQSAPGTFHGGDFAGITQEIEAGYFDDLGINAIWMTAPYEQIHGYVDSGSEHFAHYSYHGYYVLDYTEPDANYGTKAEFKTLVDTAHQHGIRIIMDIVMNHAGYNNILDMEQYDYGTIKDKSAIDQYLGKITNVGGFHDYIDYTDQAGWAKWWGDWIRSGLPGYTPPGTDEKTSSLTGLPDFRTEYGGNVGIPTFLKKKWQGEGTYDAKVSKYGASNTVTGYLTSFLADWVQTYGIDGFRCDTAKHVEFASWKALSDKCTAALKTWRQNNPNSPGAQWTDDFWMTGEHWNHNIGYGKDGYFTQGGFDSMINFETQGGGLLAAGKLASMYQGYADKINSDDSFNQLSYISSHDSCLADRNNLKYLDTALLLLPGGVQIYYGDESARPLATNCAADGDGGAGHSLRSDMNWNSMDTALLAHVQKVGSFRRDHLSIGAGSNTGLTASSGIAFARQYSKNGINDKTVCVVNASANSTVSIDVSAIWSDGTVVTNFYDETDATVSGGKVSFSAGANGVILIAEPDGEKGKVTVTHIDQDTGDTIKTEVMTGLVGTSYQTSALSTEGFKLAKTVGATSGTYTKDGASVTYYYTFDSDNYAYIKVEYVDASTGASLAESTTEVAKIGTTYSLTPVTIKDYEVDLASSTNVSGTVKAGTTTAVFKYNYVEPTNLIVHYYNSNNWTNVYLYAYQGDGATATQLAGAWPGTKMNDDGSGWWSYSVTSAEAGKVMFNDGGTNQEPGAQQPGYDATGEVWIKGGTVNASGKVVVNYVTSSGKILGTETIKGMATTSYTTQAKTFDGYTLTTTPTNASGTFTKETITVTYVYSGGAVEVTKVTLNKTSASIGVGETATFTATVTPSDAEDKTITWSSSNTSVAKVSSSGTVTGVAAGTATITAAASNGVKATATVTVTSTPVTDLTNKSKVSSTSITKGNSVTVTCAASGGSGGYTYAVYYKKASSSSFTTAQAYSSTKTVTVTPNPTETTDYTIRTKVKDSDGTVKTKDFTVTVTVENTALKNTSTISTTAFDLGSSATIKGSSTGGTGTKTYSFSYKLTSAASYTLISGFSSTATVTFKPTKAGTYTVMAKVKDGSGTIVSKTFTVYVSSGILTNTSKLSSTEVKFGGSVTVTASATGGTGDYVYTVAYKKASSEKWSNLQTYKSNTKVVVTPKVATTYDLCVKAKDSSGTIVKSYFTIKAVKAALENNSTVSATSIDLGKSVTVNCAAAGGSASYTYLVAYKKTSSEKWSTKQNYSKNATVTLKPEAAVKYDVCVKVKDSTGTIVKKYFTVSVKVPALENNSTISSLSVVKGNSVTIKGAATGGNGVYTYGYYVKKASSSTWSTIKNYSKTTSVSYKPTSATIYDLCVKVKDGKGTITKKYFSFAVNAATTKLTNTSTVSSKSVKAGTKITITGSATGITDTAMYKYEYMDVSKGTYTTIKDYSTSKTATFTPAKAGTYLVRVTIQDMKPSFAVKTLTITVS